MPRYFFRIEHELTSHDREGAEVPDKRAALGEAATMLGKMLEDIDGKMQTGTDIKIIVEDEIREPFFEMKAMLDI